MATLSQIKTRNDARAQSLWTIILSREQAHFLTNSRYWQGLQTPVGLLPPNFTGVVDSPVAANGLTRKAGSEARSWQDIAPEIVATPLSMQVQIDVYDSPVGHGFVMILRMRYDDILYERARNFGPETEREFNWKQDIIL